MCVRVCRPLADSEKLPVRSHRSSEALKTMAEEVEVVAPQEAKKKGGKEKKEKKKDKEKDRKVSNGLVNSPSVCVRRREDQQGGSSLS